MKLSEEEIDDLALKVDLAESRLLLTSVGGYLTIDAHKLVRAALRLQRERIVAELRAAKSAAVERRAQSADGAVRADALEYDRASGAIAALGNFADRLERESDG